MAELGWTAIPFAEADGGLGMGFAEVVLVTEAMGRGLAPEPFIPSIVLAGRALALGGTAQHKASWLGPAIAGEQGARARLQRAPGAVRPDARAGRATEAGGGFRLTGQATQVLGRPPRGRVRRGGAHARAHDGDREGITLFVVPAGARGLTSERQHRVDSRNAAQLTLEDVELGDADVLGRARRGPRPARRA